MGGDELSVEDKVTKERIHEIALREFMEKGYRDTSLRNIVREAGVTTGSFYWYYKSKEELFEALVGVHYDHVMKMYMEAVDHFMQYQKEEQKEHMGEVGGQCMQDMLKYMYQHKTEFKILINGSAGTKYGNFLHELTEREIESTHQFIENLKEIGFSDRAESISPEMEHIITSGMFAGLFEMIIHDIPLEKARQCVQEMHDFYTAGWAYIMNVPLPEGMKE